MTLLFFGSVLALLAVGAPIVTAIGGSALLTIFASGIATAAAIGGVIIYGTLSKASVDQLYNVGFPAGIMVGVFLGVFTLPFGLTLFTASRVLKADLKDTIKEAWPFLGAMVIVLMIITYVPASVMWIL